MASSVLAMLLLVVPAFAAQLNPVSKVITLLTDLETKITAEGEAEVKAHKEYMAWCDDTIAETGFEIKTETAQKLELEAKLAKCTSDSEVAGADIGKLAQDISTAETDLKAATALREKTNADFTASESELMDAINTLGRAITILEREMAKNPALLQQTVNSGNLQGLIQTLGAVIDAAAFSTSDRQKLVALVQSRQTADDIEDGLGAPEPEAYKTHSTNIVEVLEDMKEKAEQELSDLRKGEMESQHSYNMEKQSLEDQLAAYNKELGETKADKAEAEECIGQSKGDLAVTESDLKKSIETKAMVEQDCATAESDHKASMTGRAEELEALGKAKGVLNAMTSGAVNQTYAFVQIASSVNVHQARRSKSLAMLQQALSKVQDVANGQHSNSLAQLATRMAAVMKYGTSAGEDPFAKVKGLISDMIARLEAEASAEATHKAYCDEETKKTEAKKAELTSDIGDLTAKIDKATAEAAKLKEEVAELQKELLSLAKLQAEMDKARADEKAAYAKAKVDLETGLQGVQEAMRVLREYYAQEEALLQQPPLPVYHTKAVSAGGSIIEILEVIESDFSKNLASETLSEQEAQSEFEKITQENKIAKVTKDQDVKYKSAEAVGLEKAVAEHSSDRQGLQTELSAVLEYSEKLVEQCVVKPETYEERKARRTAEIAGLKEALTYLENPAVLIQKNRRSETGARHLRAGMN